LIDAERVSEYRPKATTALRCEYYLAVRHERREEIMNINRIRCDC